MNLFDATLSLARYLRTINILKIAGINAVNNKLVFSNLSGITGEYSNGTIWFLSGNRINEIDIIQSATSQEIRLQNAVGNCAIGDKVAISPWIDFAYQDYVNAINSVLYDYPIMACDNSLRYDSDNLKLTLPDDVRDIRRVSVQSANNENQYVVSHKWIENTDGTLVFSLAGSSYADNGIINIYYVKKHGDIYEPTDKIDPTVNEEYLMKMAALYLWRKIIIVQHKDNPIAADLFNEAKMYEQEKTKYNILQKHLLMRDFYTEW